MSTSDGGDGDGLLTDAERVALDGDPDLARDIEALAEHDPELLARLREIAEGEGEEPEEGSDESTGGSA